MKMVPTFVHIIDYKNLGDSFCCPREISAWPDAPEVDIRKLSDGDTPIIVGGGGLLHTGEDAWIEKVSQSRPCFVWGIGLNYHEKAPDDWPRFLRHCRLVGLRDRWLSRSNGFEWAPCPSVLKFDWKEARKVAPAHPIITYSHYNYPLLKRGPFMTNFDDKTIEEVVSFLASGETIVTNTYHGILWGMLLRRRVIVMKPFSCRFFLFSPPLEFVENQMQLEWRLLQKPELPDILDEYRQRSLAFKAKLEVAVSRCLSPSERSDP